MNFEQARFNMIEQQIRPCNVRDKDVLHLLSVIKREDFVPALSREMAFADMEISLGQGQCMLAPRIEARMLQDAAVRKHENVLEIGSGSGYMTALLAHQAQRVISLEINPEMVAMARANLKQAGIHNAEIRQLDAASATVIEGPFDVIMLGGSVAEVPPSLLTQLKVGGRLIAIVGTEPTMYGCIITRQSETSFNTQNSWDTVAPPLLNFPVPTQFKF